MRFDGSAGTQGTNHLAGSPTPLPMSAAPTPNDKSRSGALRIRYCYAGRTPFGKDPKAAGEVNNLYRLNLRFHLTSLDDIAATRNAKVNIRGNDLCCIIRWRYQSGMVFEDQLLFARNRN